MKTCRVTAPTRGAGSLRASPINDGVCEAKLAEALPEGAQPARRRREALSDSSSFAPATVPRLFFALPGTTVTYDSSQPVRRRSSATLPRFTWL